MQYTSLVLRHSPNQKHVTTDNSLLESNVIRRPAGNMKQNQRRFAAALNLTAVRLFAAVATATSTVLSQCQRYEKGLQIYTRYRRLVPVIRSVKLDAA